MFNIDRLRKTMMLAVGASAATLIALPSAETARAAPSPDGGALYRQRCQSCHAGAIAPSLSGVVGRKAAAGNFRYSPALKASGLTWTRPVLDRFLAGPMQLVPGTRMVIRVSDPTERAAIVDYLAQMR